MNNYPFSILTDCASSTFVWALKNERLFSKETVVWLSVQRTIQLAIATDSSFVCLNISPVASKGKALKEEWISYICHEVLNVSLQENLLFSNSKPANNFFL